MKKFNKKVIFIIAITYCFVNILVGILFLTFAEDIIAKIPVLNILVYGIGTDKPNDRGIYLSDWNEPITFEQIDSPPDGWPGDNHWFTLLSRYSRKKLKQYMKDNNLYIIPKDYPDIYSSISVEDLLGMLDFANTRGRFETTEKG